MSIADQIAPHLPSLRRYARALTGSQKSGDKYVLGLLEAMVSDPDQKPLGSDVKVELFKAFTGIWKSLDVNLETEIPSQAVDRNLTTLTPEARQAFLLMALEDFKPEEIALILKISPQEAEEYIERAGREIAEQVATSILIIEDEPLIAMDIEHLVTSLGHEVAAIARTHKQAVAEIEKHKPGMVLADIQLADGSSGIEAVNEILQTVKVPVIFITAFPERLLTGERPEPAFLVSKPFVPNMVKALISQALFFEQRAAAGR